MLNEGLFSEEDINVPLAQGQWRLERIQIYNWGTLDKLHDIAVPRKGLLFTGDSGSGKSTILDALSTILSPSNTAYNVAAASGSGEGSRNRGSYVRGAYGRASDDVGSETRLKFLREKATASGIALTYSRGEGTIWTGIGVFYLQANTELSAVKYFFFSVPGPIELKEVMTHVTDGEFKQRLRKAYPDSPFFSEPGQFRTHVLHAIGIKSTTASNLLQKAIAAKNVSSLDGLMREYMLDEPRTYEVAAQAVDQFADLSKAHQAVVDAEKQIAILKPLRTDAEIYERSVAEETHTQRLADLLEPFLNTEELALCTRDAAELVRHYNNCAAESVEVSQSIHAKENILRSLEAQRDAHGGHAQVQLEAEIDRAKQVLEDRESAWQRLRPGMEMISPDLPTSAEEFLQVRADAEATHEALTADKKALEQKGFELGMKTTELREAMKETMQEITSLRSRPNSIPPRNISLRERLCSAVGLNPDDLPYAAELIDVIDDQWRPAAERLLGNFGLTLCVPQEHADAVARWVDSTRLTDANGRGMRLEWEKYTPTPYSDEPWDADSHSILHTLELAENPATAWLRGRLTRTFNYIRVRRPEDLTRHEHAITERGQIRRGLRHIKDDTFAINDRTRWVLGTSNVDRLEALEEKYRRDEVTYNHLDQEMISVSRRMETYTQELADIAAVLAAEWHEIDTETARTTLAELEQRLAELLAPGSDLSVIVEQIDATRAEIEHLREENTKLSRKQGEYDALRRNTQARIDELRATKLLDGDLDDDDRAALEKLCGESITSTSIRNVRGHAHRRVADRLGELQKAIQKVSTRIVQAQTTYTSAWPAQSSELVAEVGAVGEFLARLDVLETDNLPEYKQQFRDLLTNTAEQNLSSLRSDIVEAFQVVRERIEPVNRSLAVTPYNSHTGEHLRIVAVDSKSATVRAFLQDLQDILTGITEADTEDFDVSEQRFHRIRDLMQRLAALRPEDARWRDEVLDTRRHVTFTAQIIDAAGNETDVYDSSRGRSGGQSQKLVTFCLAAALRFQLADDGVAMPRYGTLILDEAFDKTDPMFTRDSLEVFHQFGFQLILASPLKMLQTFEPYIGGVVQTTLGEDHRTVLGSISYRELERDLRPDDGEPVVAGAGGGAAVRSAGSGAGEPAGPGGGVGRAAGLPVGEPAAGGDGGAAVTSAHQPETEE